MRSARLRGGDRHPPTHMLSHTCPCRRAVRANVRAVAPWPGSVRTYRGYGPRLITVTVTSPEPLGSARNAPFLHCHRKAGLTCPGVAGGCSPLLPRPPPPPPRASASKAWLTDGKLQNPGGAEEPRGRCQMPPAGGALAPPSPGRRCPTFCVAASCWVGHLPTFRRQLHKSVFFSWNLGLLLMCDLQQ